MFFARLLLKAAIVPCGLAYVALKDPDDCVDLAADAADDAILADYNITPTLYQVNAILGPYYYSGNISKTIRHANLTIDKNDTSVIVVTEG